MKFYDTHFDEYIATSNKDSLHPDLAKLYDKFPKALRDLKNIIHYIYIFKFSIIYYELFIFYKY